MTLRQFKAILSRYLNGRTLNKEKEHIERWLQKLEDQSLREGHTGEFELNRQRIYENLRSELGPVPGERTVYLSWRAIAASILLLITASGVYMLRYDIADIVNPIAIKRITASAYEVHHVTLPDSSVVAVNAGSSIEYAERFRGKRRKVFLKGEAFFDVRKDPSHPFAITSGDLEVEVLGTSFVVTDFGKDSVVGVAVKTGRVAVSSRDKDLGVFLPRQDVRYNKLTGAFDLHENVDADISWTRNKFSFHETSLREIFDVIGTRYGLEISTGDPDMVLKTFTGSFEETDTPAKILDIISMSYGWTVHRTDSHYRISK